MKKNHTIFLLFAIYLVLLISGCKWSILSITAPNCASPNQSITIYIIGESQAEENSPSVYGLVLQIPESWNVLSAIATLDGASRTLTKNTEYASLYTPEPGHKIWIGTSKESENTPTDGIATVKLSVGDCAGQFRIKAAAGSYRNGVWTNDDPFNEFNFVNITEERYVHTISCDCASLTPWSPMISGTLNHLYGVWGNSGSDVFAVGSDGTILHYNGSQWSIMASWTTNLLYDVWGSSGNDVFAVGTSGIILHHDGNSWTPMTSENTNHLFGVWGSSNSDVFAVGYDGTILHYDGNQWSVMESWTTKSLNGIWGSSNSDVFAVGDGGTIRHYDGNSWTPMTSGNTSYLNSVWGSSDSDVFAVGSHASTILHYNGSSWAPMTSGTLNGLNGVWGSSGSDVFAVGDIENILHYDGSIWTPMSSGTSTNWLMGVWGSSNSDVFAVGRVGTIFHYVPTTLYVSKDGLCGGNSPCYTAIQVAINAAPTVSSIQIVQGTYTEPIILNASKDLTLNGNWDADFTTQTSITVLRQAPKASKGSLTLQDLKIKP